VSLDNLKIERMTLADIPEVVKIERESFSDPWEVESFLLDLKNKNAYPLVAKIEGKVIGYTSLWIVEDEMDIANIAVAPEQRSQGMGKKLMQHILDLAKEKKCKKVSLDVRESNSSALKLYKSFGFEKKGRRKKYYQNPPEDALILIKELD
jgi:ribosomal-protein-alanine N-acetyltransferase